MQTSEWRRTSAWSMLFFLGRFLKGIVKNAGQSLAPLAAVLVAFEGSLADKLTLIAVAAALLAASVSILRYLFFRYRVSDDSILIRDGVFRKKQLDIKFDRIQGVNTQQNFIYRWLDLVTVEFDTAGSATSEGNLPAVESDFADQLQSRIDGTPTIADGESTEDDGNAPRPESDVLLELGWRDMVKIGLSDGRVLIVFAIIGPFMEQMGDQIDDYISAYAETAFDQISSLGVAGGGLLVVAVMLSVALLLASISIAGAFLRYHNFRLTLDGTKLRSVGGLMTSHRVSMDVKKVQRIRMSQGLILKLFGRYRIVCQQASSSGSKQESSSFKVPLVEQGFGAAFTRRVFAPEAPDVCMDPRDPGFVNVSPRYIRSRVLLVGVLPLLPAATPVAIAAGPAALLLLLWPAIVWLGVRRYWRRLGYRWDADVMVRRSGMLGFRLDAFLLRKVQRVTVTQSLLQRRRSLAGLRIFLASGSVRIPYIAVEEAHRLRDFILYRVESSQRSWH